METSVSTAAAAVVVEAAGDAGTEVPTSEVSPTSRIGTRCGICFEGYTARCRNPKQMQCGHTFCLRCVNQLVQLDGPVITCPSCREKTISHNGILPTNYFALDLLSSGNLLENDGDTDEVAAMEENPSVMLRWTFQEVDARVKEAVPLILAEVDRIQNAMQAIKMDYKMCYRERDLRHALPYGFPINGDSTQSGANWLDSITDAAKQTLAFWKTAPEAITNAYARYLEVVSAVDDGDVVIVNGNPVISSNTRRPHYDMPWADHAQVPVARVSTGTTTSGDEGLLYPRNIIRADHLDSDEAFEEVLRRYRREYRVPEPRLTIRSSGHSESVNLSDHDDLSDDSDDEILTGDSEADDVISDADGVDSSDNWSTVNTTGSNADRWRSESGGNQSCLLCFCSVPSGDRGWATHVAGRNHTNADPTASPSSSSTAVRTLAPQRTMRTINQTLPNFADHDPNLPFEFELGYGVNMLPRATTIRNRRYMRTRRGNGTIQYSPVGNDDGRTTVAPPVFLRPPSTEPRLTPVARDHNSSMPRTPQVPVPHRYRDPAPSTTAVPGELSFHYNIFEQANDEVSSAGRQDEQQHPEWFSD